MLCIQQFLKCLLQQKFVTPYCKSKYSSHQHKSFLALSLLLVSCKVDKIWPSPESTKWHISLLGCKYFNRYKTTITSWGILEPKLTCSQLHGSASTTNAPYCGGHGFNSHCMSSRVFFKNKYRSLSPST